MFKNWPILVILSISFFLNGGCKNNKSDHSTKLSPLVKLNTGCWMPLNLSKVPYKTRNDQLAETSKSDSMVYAAPPVWLIDENKKELKSFFIIPHVHYLNNDKQKGWVVNVYNKNQWKIKSKQQDSLLFSINTKEKEIEIAYVRMNRDPYTKAYNLFKLKTLFSGSSWVGNLPKGNFFEFGKDHNINTDKLFDYSSLNIKNLYLPSDSSKQNTAFKNLEFNQYKDLIIADFISNLPGNNSYILQQINTSEDTLIWKACPSNNNQADLVLTKVK